MRKTTTLYSFGIVLAVCSALVVGSGPALAVAPSPSSTDLPARQQLPSPHRHHHGPSQPHDIHHRGGTPSPDPSLADVTLGDNPLSIAIDQATHTAYVTNFNDNTMSIVDISKCNVRAISGCAASAPTVDVTPEPFWADIDLATNTVYVAGFGSNYISVIDGVTCNAGDTAGCSTPPATVTVGDGPDGLAINQKTDTIYVANNGPGGDYSGNTVSVVDGATCNSSNTSGCSATPPVVTVGLGPGTPSVDELTNTIYVPNTNYGGVGSVSVINGATCDATVTSGCSQTPATTNVGPNAYDVTVDPATDTVYEPTFSSIVEPTYVINGATCNGTNHSGCGKKPVAVPGGAGADQALVDPATRSVFILNQEDSTISVINSTRCNAVHTSGCAATPQLITTGYNPGAMGLDLATQALYETNQDENTMSVLNALNCSDSRQTGCRTEAPTTTVGNEPSGVVTNPVTNTIYVSNRADETLSVINGARCNAASVAACRTASWPTVDVGGNPQAVAVDSRTDTIYTANFNADTGTGNTVSVINGATCNRTVTSGCSAAPVVLTVGNNPVYLAVNEATDTIYVTNQADSTLSVINGATCNGTVHTGCGSDFPVATVGSDPSYVAVDQATNTVYVSNGGSNTVSVINGKTCDAEDTSGCGTAAPTTTIGNSPDGLVVDHATHTLYAVNVGDSTVSVINEAVCNATVSSGCAQTWPTMSTGGYPILEPDLDQQRNELFVPSVVASGVDIFALDRCDAENSSGCATPPKLVPAAGWPACVTYDPDNETVYVADNVDGLVSLFSPTGGF